MRERKRLVWQVELLAKNHWEPSQALLDSGAERNLVSQILVKKRGWKPEGPPLQFHDINGRSYHCYGVHWLSVRIRDACGKVCEARQQFYAVDTDEHDVLLGYPWHEDFDPDCDWKAKTFRFRIERGDLELQGPKTFEHNVSEKDTVYAVCIAGVDGASTDGRTTITTAILNNATVELKLPIIIKK